MIKRIKLVEISAYSCLKEKKMNKKVEVICKECNSEFLFDTVEIKQKEKVKIDNDTFTIIYYKCPECGAIQLVGMLNYRAKRIRDSYFAAYDSVRKMEATGNHMLRPAIYKQRKDKLEKLKLENTEYQQMLLNKYKDKIPTEVFRRYM